MKHRARLKSVVELLETVLDQENRSPADDIFVKYCRDRRYIGSKDRQFIGDYFFNILRFCEGLKNALKGATNARFLALTYWYVDEGSFDLLLDEEDLPYSLTKPNAHETEIIIRAAKDFKEDPYQIPRWTAPHFESFGDQAKDHIKALHEEAPFDIRINPLLIDREAALTEFVRQRIKATPCSLSPFGIRLSERVPLQGLEIWKDGHIEIQDEGAQLISLLCDVKPNHQVLDYCAGAGGKTLLLAALMQNKGRLIATDLYTRRLEQGQKRYRRAQVHNIQIKDLKDTKWWKRHQQSFDRVLIDVPCSGSGTWRRNPDLKMRFHKKDLNEILKVQADILNTAKQYVKPGGYFIYATCSLWQCENQKQIEQFLANNPNFHLMNVSKAFNHLQETGKALELDNTEASVYDASLQLTPFEHHVDGFFICVMQKTAAEN